MSKKIRYSEEDFENEQEENDIMWSLRNIAVTVFSAPFRMLFECSKKFIFLPKNKKINFISVACGLSLLLLVIRVVLGFFDYATYFPVWVYGVVVLVMFLLFIVVSKYDSIIDSVEPSDWYEEELYEDERKEEDEQDIEEVKQGSHEEDEDDFSLEGIDLTQQENSGFSLEDLNLEDDLTFEEKKSFEDFNHRGVIKVSNKEEMLELVDLQRELQKDDLKAENIMNTGLARKILNHNIMDDYADLLPTKSIAEQWEV